jgi:hypothetical protein
VTPTLGLILGDANVHRLKSAADDVQLLLLERTLLDPPRAAAAARWGEMLRQQFPNAELLPYVWHLISHAVEDGLRDRGSRGLAGDPHTFGGLQPTPQNDQAWNAFEQCVEALGAKRVVLRTPISITPGALGRRRIRAFVDKHRDCGFVWEPQGLWTPSEAAGFAKDVPLTLLHPAFEGGRPIDDVDDDAWLRVDPVGRHAKLGGAQLDALADRLDALDGRGAVIVFSGPHALTNLRAVASGP